MTRSEMIAIQAELFGLLDGYVEPETKKRFNDTKQHILSLTDEEFEKYVDDFNDYRYGEL